MHCIVNGQRTKLRCALRDFVQYCIKIRRQLVKEQQTLISSLCYLQVDECVLLGRVRDLLPGKQGSDGALLELSGLILGSANSQLPTTKGGITPLVVGLCSPQTGL